MSNPQPKNVIGLSTYNSSGEMRFCTIDRLERGNVWIRVSSCEEPMKARFTGSLLGRISGIPIDRLSGNEVLVWFSGQRPRPAPVIVDFVFDKVPETTERRHPVVPPGDVEDILVDGKNITMEAGESIEFRCGSSRLIFTADGKILLRGKQVTSQASDHNLIRGAVVKIN